MVLNTVATSKYGSDESMQIPELLSPDSVSQFKGDMSLGY